MVIQRLNIRKTYWLIAAILIVLSAGLYGPDAAFSQTNDLVTEMVHGPESFTDISPPNPGGTVSPGTGRMTQRASTGFAGDEHYESWTRVTLRRDRNIAHTIVRTSVEVEEGRVELWSALAGYSNAGTALNLEVLDGTEVLCSDEVILADLSQNSGRDNHFIPRATHELSCGFDREAGGSIFPVARVKLRSWAIAAVAAGAHAETKVQINSISEQHYTQSIRWCRHPGATLYVADPNGDGRDDLICHTSPGSGWIDIDYADRSGGFGERTDFQVQRSWCVHEGATLYIGDVNGDGRDDLICHTSPGSGWITLLYANEEGQYKGINDWASTAGGWCYHPGAALHLGDVDGDGDDDLICHTQPSGWTTISRAENGRFSMINDDVISVPWCNETRATLHVGDVNNNGRDDLICHSPLTGNVKVDLANNSDVPYDHVSDFDNEPRAWCSHDSTRMLVADANGDNRDDLICHTSSTGHVVFNLANPAGNFLNIGPPAIDFNFCEVENSRMVAVDFDGRNGVGLICQDRDSQTNTTLLNLW